MVAKLLGLRIQNKKIILVVRSSAIPAWNENGIVKRNALAFANRPCRFLYSCIANQYPPPPHATPPYPENLWLQIHHLDVDRICVFKRVDCVYVPHSQSQREEKYIEKQPSMEGRHWRWVNSIDHHIK
jgi:hypothetical protein